MNYLERVLIVLNLSKIYEYFKMDNIPRCGAWGTIERKGMLVWIGRDGHQLGFIHILENNEK